MPNLMDYRLAASRDYDAVYGRLVDIAVNRGMTRQQAQADHRIQVYAQQIIGGGTPDLFDAYREQVQPGSSADAFIGANITPDQFVADQITGSADGAPEGPTDAYLELERILRSIELEELIPFAKQQVANNVTADEFILDLRDQDAFRERFAAIFDLEGQGRQLVPGGGLLEQAAAVLAYENAAKELLEDLPPSFYDSPEDFRTFIAAGLSIDELAQRIDEGYASVRDAPAEVRDAFASFFGVSGDDALAAYFLDPTRAETALLDQVRQAEISGAGAMFGFNVNRQKAERLGDFGFGFQQARTGFAQAARLRPLSTELTFERDDLTDDDLVGATFGVDAGASERVRRRQEARVAPFQGGGGASFGDRGLVGAGEA